MPTIRQASYCNRACHINRQRKPGGIYKNVYQDHSVALIRNTRPRCPTCVTSVAKSVILLKNARQAHVTIAERKDTGRRIALLSGYISQEVRHAIIKITFRLEISKFLNTCSC